MLVNHLLINISNILFAFIFLSYQSFSDQSCLLRSVYVHCDCGVLPYQVMCLYVMCLIQVEQVCVFQVLNMQNIWVTALDYSVKHVVIEYLLIKVVKDCFSYAGHIRAIHSDEE